MAPKTLPSKIIQLFLFLTSWTTPKPIQSNELSDTDPLTCKHVFEYFHHFEFGNYSTLNCVMNRLNLSSSNDLRECRNFKNLAFNDSILSRHYNSALDAIKVSNRLCQHNFDKIFAEYFGNMQAYYNNTIKKVNLNCYLKKLKQLRTELSYSNEFLGRRNCQDESAEIDNFLEDTRNMIVQDLHEERIYHCMGSDLVDDKVYEKLEFKIIANNKYTAEETVALRNKLIVKFKKFEEKKIDCFLKHFYHHHKEE